MLSLFSKCWFLPSFSIMYMNSSCRPYYCHFYLVIYHGPLSKSGFWLDEKLPLNNNKKSLFFKRDFLLLLLFY